MTVSTRTGCHSSQIAARGAPLRDESGFTLVELLVALSVFMVVITIALGELSSGITRTRDLDKSANTATTTRLSINEMVRELRQASTDDVAVPVFASISPTAVTFYSPDRLTPKHLRKIRYRLAAGVVQRAEEVSTNAGNPPWTFSGAVPIWTTVVVDVTNTDIFTFLDVAGIATTTSAKVSRVTVRVEAKSGLSASGRATYRTDVDIRIQR